MQYFRINKYVASSCGFFNWALVTKWQPVDTISKRRYCNRTAETTIVHLQFKAEWQVVAGAQVMLRVGQGQPTKNV